MVLSLREARIDLQGALDPKLNVPVLSKGSLYTEKLLANTDRGTDAAILSRDLIDLAMMIKSWGPIPKTSWDDAHAAYGAQVSRMFHRALGLISDPKHLAHCLSAMKMDERLLQDIPQILERAAGTMPFSDEEASERARRIARLGDLQHGSAPAKTFWRLATAAASSHPVDWSRVEQDTIRQCIAEDGIVPEMVAEILLRHSPGAASQDRQAVLEKNIDRFAKQQEATEDAGVASQKKDCGLG